MRGRRRSRKERSRKRLGTERTDLMDVRTSYGRVVIVGVKASGLLQFFHSGRADGQQKLGRAVY